MLFSGTIRSNLDPFGLHIDAELYESLGRVQFTCSARTDATEQSDSAAPKLYDYLSSPVSESGGNLSQGQQQLLCIARALLARSKIIILDEATSAIDAATDALIQHNIREWFTDRTLIVIAHRLSTVADFDRILVLDDGQMVEFGRPRDLWERNGAFRNMCESAGRSEREELRACILGQKGGVNL